MEHGEKIPCCDIFVTYREKNVTTNLMKHKGKKYLVVTFSSPIGKKYVTTNLMKHKGKKYLVVTFSSPIGEKNVTTNLMKHKGKNTLL